MAAQLARLHVSEPGILVYEITAFLAACYRVGLILDIMAILQYFVHLHDDKLIWMIDSLIDWV